MNTFLELHDPVHGCHESTPQLCDIIRIEASRLGGWQCSVCSKDFNEIFPYLHIERQVFFHFFRYKKFSKQ